MTPSRSSTSAASRGSTSRLHIQYLRWAAHRAVRRHSRRDTARFGWLFVEGRMRLLSSRRGSLLHEWVIGSYLGVGSAWSRAISSERWCESAPAGSWKLLVSEAGVEAAESVAAQL